MAGEKRDATLATADLLAMVSVAQQIRESPTLVSDLISLWSYEMAGACTWGLLLSKDPAVFTTAQLGELEKQFAAFDKGDLHVRLDGERDMFKDMVQRMYSDDGQGDGFFHAETMTAGFFDSAKPDLFLKLTRRWQPGDFPRGGKSWRRTSASAPRWNSISAGHGGTRPLRSTNPNMKSSAGISGTDSSI